MSEKLTASTSTVFSTKVDIFETAIIQGIVSLGLAASESGALSTSVSAEFTHLAVTLAAALATAISAVIPLHASCSKTSSSQANVPQCRVGSCNGILVTVNVTANAGGGNPPYTYKITYADGVVHTIGPTNNTSVTDSNSDCCLGTGISLSVTDNAGNTANSSC